MVFFYNISIEPLTVKLLRTIVHTTTGIEPQFLLCFMINSNPALCRDTLQKYPATPIASRHASFQEKHILKKQL